MSEITHQNQFNLAGNTPFEVARFITDRLQIGGITGRWLIDAICTACQHFSNEELERSGHRRMGAYLERQREWSERTFGPGRRTVGITKHIEKEITEVRNDPDDLMEWIDIMILAIDGFWRAGGHPSQLMEMLEAKQAKNFARKWPPILPEDEITEHDRSEEVTA